MSIKEMCSRVVITFTSTYTSEIVLVVLSDSSHIPRLVNIKQHAVWRCNSSEPGYIKITFPSVNFHI